MSIPKTKRRGELRTKQAVKALDGATCDQLALGLLRVLKDGKPIAPSETIEFVNAAIGYLSATDNILGSTTDGLYDLIEARGNYTGPGIIR